MGLGLTVSRLRGVDVKLSAKLKRIGVSTIRDLLFLMPRRHNDFATTAKISELVPGVEQTVIATVWEARETSLSRKLKAAEAVLSDETGNIRAVWFGQPYLARTLKPNSRVAVSGRVDIFKGQRQFNSPEFEILDRGDVVHPHRQAGARLSFHRGTDPAAHPRHRLAGVGGVVPSFGRPSA